MSNSTESVGRECGRAAALRSSTGLALSVVVPVHDERENIAPLVREIVAALAGVVPFEIVYVDDGSDDGTGEALQLMQQQVPNLRVLRHERSAGQSTAIRTGVMAAQGHWIATLDGDGQNDPADIPALLTKACSLAAQRGDDRLLIAGWRTQRKDTRWTRWQSRVANGVRSRLLRDGTPDTGCGLKVYARATYLALPYFDHMHRFMPALVRREGGEVQSVPVNHRPRTRGHSHYGALNRLFTGVVDMAGVVWLASRARAPKVAEVTAPVLTRQG
ncbi:MAG TPA: glycosyltransferase family 2 protein [Gemmatimonadaceae bacterium]|nr:glycosyltransferase family 2 protein [Gemmatimonadaceae bacterium]